MMGIEMMLSNLIGLKPEELRDIAIKITTGVETMQADISSMKGEISEIKAHLGLETNNDDGNRASIGNSGSPKRGGGSNIKL